MPLHLHTQKHLQQIGGGASFVTQFSDNFSGAGKFMGDNWAILGCDASVLNMVDVDTNINLTAGQLVLGGAVAALGNLRLIMVPFPAIDARVVKAQSLVRGVFAQATFISRATGAGGYYAGVMAYNTAPDDGKCYYFGVDQAGQADFTRNIDATETNLATNIFAAAGNDVFRIEVVPSSTGNLVTGKRNGTTVFTTNDTNAGRPAFTGGWYGMFFRYQIDGGANSIWDNFSGGLI